MKYYKESSNANEWRHISQGKAVEAPQWPPVDLVANLAKTWDS